ncbi:MAG TPA: glycine--tRNA ligase subunit beta, partial [Bacillota bacterium]|nr:glycine--tRNA ligase subunit beta [Bacillota bacterium]
QYLPRFSGDALPQTLPGKLLAIADKVDSVVGCFRAGLIPTGSEDPYALRRAALGALSILLDSDLSLELVDLLKYAETLYGKPEKTQSLKEFFWGRLKGILHEVGWQHSLTSAVLAAPSSDVVSLKKRGEAIEGFMAAPEFGNLLVAYNRAANLAQKGTTSTVEEKLLVEEAEKQLWTAFCRIKEEANEALSREDWQAALASLSRLREPLDAFFDGVLVMAKEEEVRINRLAILRSITELFSSIADFKALEV